MPNIELLSCIRVTPALIKTCVEVRDISGARDIVPDDSFLEFRDGETALTNPSLEWLSSRPGEVAPASFDESSEFNRRIASFLRLINEARCTKTYARSTTQWSAGYLELALHRNLLGHDVSADSAESWIAPLGVSYTADELFLVFKFTGADAGFLCRPNHLDAGFYREHFPSPLDAVETWFAHPMFLCNGDIDADLPLIPEFVHPAVRFRREHLHAIATTSSASSMELIPNHRLAHWPRLAERYPECVLAETLFPGHTGTERCGSACGCSADACKAIFAV